MSFLEEQLLKLMELVLSRMDACDSPIRVSIGILGH